MKALSFFLLSLMLLGCQKATLELPEGTPRFTAEPYVNPRIIQDFVGWLSDSDNIITGVDLLNAQESNRYSIGGEIEKTLINGKYWITASHEGRFSYSVSRQIENNTFLLDAMDVSTGSFIGRYKLIVQYGMETINGEERVVLKYLGNWE